MNHIGKTLLKSALAALAIGTITLIASRNIAPHLVPTIVLQYLLLGIAVLSLIFISVILIKTKINQWVLNHGGTDSAWLWFNSAPPGLDKLKATTSESN